METDTLEKQKTYYPSLTKLAYSLKPILTKKILIAENTNWTKQNFDSLKTLFFV